MTKRSNNGYGPAFERDLHLAFGRHVDEASIALALDLVRGHIDPRETKAGEARYRECYHPPSHHDMLMHALNAALETHGLEYIGEVDMHDGPPVEYLNAGDSYAVTLVWYRDTDRFRVQDYATAVEWCERKGLT
jgi:hypothetical protein